MQGHERNSTNNHWGKRLGVVAITAVLASLTTLGALAASAQFGDIVPGHPHEEGIGFAAESGVTAGCGDGSNYCPNDPVTRAQMGTFLHRLSGHADGVAPSVDAATLQGKTPGELMPEAAMPSTAVERFGLALDVTDAESLGSVTIEVPASGTIVAQGQASVQVGGGGTAVSLDIADSAGSIISGTGGTSFVGLLTGDQTDPTRFDANPMRVFEVDAGTHTFHLNAERSGVHDEHQVNIGHSKLLLSFTADGS